MFKNTRYILLLILILSYGIVFIGCDDTEEHEEHQDEHVCEHLLESEGVAIDAVADAQTAVDSLASDDSYRIQAQDHIRYDLTLMQDTTQLYYGFVPYKPIDGDGEYILYLDTEANVELINFTESTTVVPEEVTDHSDYCGEIHHKAVYDLHEEDTYVLSFYETIDSSVGVVFVIAEDHDDHEDHDH